MIPYDSPPCYHSSMRHLVVLFIHFIATLARLLGPGGVRSLVAESLLLKHQLLIVNRSRQRTPNLQSSDRILAGLLAHLVRPTRLLRSAIVLKPSTLLAIHKAMSKQKYRMLFSSQRRRKPGPTYIRHQWLRDFPKALDGIRSTWGRLPIKPSGTCVLGCCALRESDRFTPTVSIRQRQESQSKSFPATGRSTNVRCTFQPISWSKFLGISLFAKFIFLM